MSAVDDIIQDQRTYAAEAVEAAHEALADAQDAIDDFPRFGVTFYNYNPQNIQLAEIEDLDDFDASYANEVALPTPPEYLSFTPGNIVIPAPPTVDYTVDEIERPVFDVSKFTEVAPLTPDFDLPPDPELVIKSAPTITEIDLGTLAEVTPPEFDAEFNEIAPSFDGDLKAEYLAQYERALPEIQNFVDNQMDAWVGRFAPGYHTNRAQLEAKIAEDMADGRAMTEEFETALYNRARARVEKERERTEKDLDSAFAKRGFILPQGVLTAGRNKLHQAAADNIASQSTELAIERAKMEIQHKQFVMGLSQDLHKHVQGMAMQYAGVLLDMNRQALESSKEVASVVARNYELLLNRYKEVANVYAIQASTYKVRLEASLANVEVFKARAEAAKVSASVDAVKLQAYEQELKFELAKVDVYRAQLEGVKAVVEIGKQQIDIYGAKAQAYVATVKGKESEFNAYAAAIRGEETKVKVESLKVDAYKAEIQGALARVEADKLKADTVNEFNRNEATVYKAGIDAFNAGANAESNRIRSAATAYGAKAEVYKAKADVEISESSLKIENEKLKLQAITADWQVTSSENIAAGKIAVEKARGIAQVSTQAADVLARIAGSALSSQNSMVSKSESA